MKQTEDYDVLIVGGGPCGLSAALYCARGGRKTAVIEKAVCGGQITKTQRVENYPGGLLEDSGIALSQRMKAQAEQFGAVFIQDEIYRAELSSKEKYLYSQTKQYKGKCVILCPGAAPRALQIPGEEAFKGRGVSYCAVCDGFFFKDRTVIVVGGGEAALEESLFLAGFAREVILVHRSDRFRAAAFTQQRVREHPRIRTLLHTELKEIRGEDFVRQVIVQDRMTGKKTVCSVRSAEDFMGVFIFAGNLPATEAFAGQIKTDKNGYFIANEKMQTNLLGVFAAGDARKKSLRQVITAAADGAIAGTEAVAFLNEIYKKDMEL